MAWRCIESRATPGAGTFQTATYVNITDFSLPGTPLIILIFFPGTSRRQDQGNYFDRLRSCNQAPGVPHGSTELSMLKGLPDFRAQIQEDCSESSILSDVRQKSSSGEDESLAPSLGGSGLHAARLYKLWDPGNSRLRGVKPGYSDATASKIIGLLGLGKVEVTIRKKFIICSPTSFPSSNGENIL
ncbi:hypothetical protein B0H19DRAFT_1078985 [Mycena capillaripes]|nr:hypothetical protein B0H19DRAFT_1078985 [Mycena capillaripes]